MTTTSEQAKGTSKTSSPVEKKTSKKTEEKTTGAIQLAQPRIIFGNRPVTPSSLVVVDTMNQAGIRPIMAGSLKVHHTMHASGDRPIVSSSLVITGMLTETRPIASNVIDDYEVLMGYLD